MAVVAVSQILLLLAGLAVAGRLVALFLRTRHTPELLIGLGLALVVVTLPLLGASGVGRVSAGELRMGWLATGLATLATGQTLLAAFTWRCFRPSSGWAAGLWLAIALAQIGTALWAGLRLAGLPPEADPLERGMAAMLAMRMPATLAFIWTALEGWHAYRMARRRLELGLADPLVVNRFALWTGIGVVAAVNNLGSTALQAVGRGPVHDPVGAAFVSIGAIVSAALLYLAFLPPAAWVRWITRPA